MKVTDLKTVQEGLEIIKHVEGFRKRLKHDNRVYLVPNGCKYTSNQTFVLDIPKEGTKEGSLRSVMKSAGYVFLETLEEALEQYHKEVVDYLTGLGIEGITTTLGADELFGEAGSDA